MKGSTGDDQNTHISKIQKNKHIFQKNASNCETYLHTALLKGLSIVKIIIEKIHVLRTLKRYFTCYHSIFSLFIKSFNHHLSKHH